MITTHVFKLPSGVACEIEPLMGEHQDIFLDKTFEKEGTQIAQLLFAVVVRIGTKRKPDLTINDILDLLSQDARHIMLQLRIFSNGDAKFEFEYTFKHQGKTFKHPVSVDLNEVVVTPCMMFTGEWKPMDCEEYSEVNALKKQRVALKNGKAVYIQLLDLRTEIAAKDMKERSLLTALKLRKPTYLSGETECILNVARNPLFENGEICTYFKKAEGFVDTIVEFENPYFKEDEEGQDTIKFDLLSVKDFLFAGIL